MADSGRGASRTGLFATFVVLTVLAAQVVDAPSSGGVRAAADPGSAPVPAQPVGAVVWQDRFDTGELGPLTTATGNRLFDPRAGDAQSNYAHATLAADPAGGNLLQHTLPAGQLGNFFVTPKLTRDVEHAVLQYDIRFDDNFDWRWGGKIPGLVGVAPGVPIYAPTSGTRNRDVGFSTRLMWHGRGDNGSRPYQDALGPIPPDRDNMLVTYAYVRQPEQGFDGYGWQTNLGAGFTRGVWHTVRMEVKLNTAGMADGVYRVWIDNDLRFEATDWDYRNSAQVKIQAVLYDIHRGGNNSPGWVSARDSSIEMRHVSVTELS
ncbi:polysaccharide lyase [Mycobacterium sp. C31M]